MLCQFLLCLLLAAARFVQNDDLTTLTTGGAGGSEKLPGGHRARRRLVARSGDVVMCVADETASAAPLLAALDAGAGTSPFQRVGHTVSVSAGSVHRAVMLSAEIPFNRAGFVGHAMRA
jgi:hypothetical protein